MVAGLPRHVVDRVIVADGGSTDDTVERRAAPARRSIEAGRGYGRACLAGAQAADDADIIVFMDGDGADDPAAIAGMVDAIRSGSYDFVIGSRARGEREPGSMASHQFFAGLAAGALIGFLYGVRYTDMCAYRAIRRETLLALGMRELTYGWNLEMQMRAARAGLRVLELPVAYRCRAGGEIQSRRQLARIDQGRLTHHRDFRARGAGAGALLIARQVSGCDIADRRHALKPPSTIRRLPVVKLDASEARKSTERATSSARTWR